MLWTFSYFIYMGMARRVSVVGCVVLVSSASPLLPPPGSGSNVGAGPGPRLTPHRTNFRSSIPTTALRLGMPMLG
jgi:hypothetical protein